MQTLIVFKEDTRELLAAFHLQTIVTEMNIVKVPGVSYLMTLEKDIFYTVPNGTVFVKDIK